MPGACWKLGRRQALLGPPPLPTPERVGRKVDQTTGPRIVTGRQGKVVPPTLVVKGELLGNSAPGC